MLTDDIKSMTGFLCRYYLDVMHDPEYQPQAFEFDYIAHFKALFHVINFIKDNHLTLPQTLDELHDQLAELIVDITLNTEYEDN